MLDVDAKKYFFKLIQTLILILTTIIILYVSINFSWILGIGVGLLPLLLFASLYIISNPYWALISVFILNYYIMGSTRYLDIISGGLVMDISLIYILVSLIFYNFKTRLIDLKKLNTPIFYCVLIWFIYCVLELFNPETVTIKSWLTGARGVSIYFLFIVIFTLLICNKYKQMKTIILIWSILTLTAIVKCLMQKYYGFDSAETRWLYEGGDKTHIIYSGIRYFSFFTDAANFGAGMGFSFISFFIFTIGEKSKKLKVYYLLVASLAFYGMMLSGTRAAIAVPFIGLASYVLLSKKIKSIIIGSIILVSIFIFFKYTEKGNSYSEIRRMRTAFDPKEDASYLIRKANQTKLVNLMEDKYFGYGIGMGGGKAKQYDSNSAIAQIPTDSWFVMIWVETGLIGLIINIGVLLFIFLYAAYIITFKIKDKELRIYLIGFFGGTLGMTIASYANEIFGQFPNGFIIYTGLSFLYLGKYFDKEIEENKNLISLKANE